MKSSLPRTRHDLSKRTRAAQQRFAARNGFAKRHLMHGSVAWPLALMFRRGMRPHSSILAQRLLTAHYTLQLVFSPSFDRRQQHFSRQIRHEGARSGSTHMMTIHAQPRWTSILRTLPLPRRVEPRNLPAPILPPTPGRVLHIPSGRAADAAHPRPRMQPSPRGVTTIVSVQSAGTVVTAPPLALQAPRVFRRAPAPPAAPVRADPPLPRWQQERPSHGRDQPALSALAPLQVELLAEQVMRHIDRKVIATRERLGRI